MNEHAHNNTEQANPWLEGVKDLEDLGAENPDHPTRSALARAFLGVCRVLGAVLVGVLKLAAGFGIVALAMAGSQKRDEDEPDPTRDYDSHHPDRVGNPNYHWTGAGGWKKIGQW